MKQFHILDNKQYSKMRSQNFSKILVLLVPILLVLTISISPVFAERSISEYGIGTGNKGEFALPGVLQLTSTATTGTTCSDTYASFTTLDELVLADSDLSGTCGRLIYTFNVTGIPDYANVTRIALNMWNAATNTQFLDIYGISTRTINSTNIGQALWDDADDGVPFLDDSTVNAYEPGTNCCVIKDPLELNSLGIADLEAKLQAGHTEYSLAFILDNNVRESFGESKHVFFFSKGMRLSITWDQNVDSISNLSILDDSISTVQLTNTPTVNQGSNQGTYYFKTVGSNDCPEPFNVTCANQRAWWTLDGEGTGLENKTPANVVKNTFTKEPTVTLEMEKSQIIGNDILAIQLNCCNGGKDDSSANAQILDFGSEESLGTGVVVHEKKAYVVGQTGQDVSEYDLAFAWNMNGGAGAYTFVDSTSVATNSITPTDIRWSYPTGDKMFILDDDDNDVDEYTCTTNWDTSTCTYSISFSVGTQETLPSGLDFGNSGTRMYIVGTSNDTIYQYDCSTGYLISSCSYSGKSFSVQGQESLPEGLHVSTDGTSIFLMGGFDHTSPEVGNRLFQYHCWNPHELDSCQFIRYQLIRASPAPDHTGIFMDENGIYLYMLNQQNDRVSQQVMANFKNLAVIDNFSADAVFGTNADQVIEDFTTYTDQTDANLSWTPNDDTAGRRVNVDTNILEFDLEGFSSANNNIIYDLGSPLATEFTIRAELNFTDFSNPTTEQTAWFGIFSGDETVPSSTAQDFIGVQFTLDTGGGHNFQIFDADNESLTHSVPAADDFEMPLELGPLNIEITRLAFPNGTSVRYQVLVFGNSTSITDPSNYSKLLDKKLLTFDSSGNPASLQYLGVKNEVGANRLGTMNGTLQNVEIWDNRGLPGAFANGQFIGLLDYTSVYPDIDTAGQAGQEFQPSHDDRGDAISFGFGSSVLRLEHFYFEDTVEGSVSIWFKTNSQQNSGCSSFMTLFTGATSIISTGSRDFAPLVLNGCERPHFSFSHTGIPNLRAAMDTSIPFPASTNNFIAQNTWHNLVYVGEIGVGNKFYLDGEISGTGNIGDLVYNQGDVNDHFWFDQARALFGAGVLDMAGIGLTGSNSGTDRNYHGIVDDFYYFEEILTDEDVKLLYNEGRSIGMLPTDKELPDLLLKAGKTDFVVSNNSTGTLTANFTDPFTTDQWTATDTSPAVNTGTGVLDFDVTNNGSSDNDTVAYEHTGAIADDFTLRYKIHFDAISGASNGQLYVGLHSEDETQNWASSTTIREDGIGVEFGYVSSGSETIKIAYEDSNGGLTLGSDCGLAWVIGTDYYIQESKHFDTVYLTVYSDSAYSLPLCNVNQVVPITTDRMDHIKIGNVDNSGTVGHLDGFIDDIELYDGWSGFLSSDAGSLLFDNLTYFTTRTAETQFDFERNQDFTIAFDLYTTDSLGQQTLFDKRATVGGAGYYIFQDSAEKINFIVHDGTNRLECESTSASTNRAWEHWLISYEGTLGVDCDNVDFYKNGVSDTTVTVLETITVTSLNNADITIGAEVDGTDTLDYGSMIDNIKIYAEAKDSGNATAIANWDITSTTLVTKSTTAEASSNFWKAITVNQLGFGSISAASQCLFVEGDSNCAPDIPTNLVTTPLNSTQIDLTWVEPATGEPADYSIYRHSIVDVAFDMSTASYSSILNITAQDETPHDIQWNNDGTKMFMTGSGSDRVNQYNCSAFILDTCSFDSSFFVQPQEGQPYGSTWNNDGTKMFISGNTDKVYEYICDAFEVSTCSYDSEFDISEDTLVTSHSWSNDGTKLFVAGFVGDEINEYSCTAFDVSTCSFDSRFDLNDSNPRGMSWNDDGTVMYVTGNGDIAQYDCSAFDVSTCSFDTDFFLVNSHSGNPDAVIWNDVGTKMYVVGDAPATPHDTIFEYACTDFDVSTCSFEPEFSVTTQDTVPRGMTWNLDGTKMFMVGNQNDRVYEYTCSAFDIPTCSYDSEFVHTSGNVQGMSWNNNGTKMYVVESNSNLISEASCTAFDVSTCSDASSDLDVTSQDTGQTGMSWNLDGTKMFMIGQNSMNINEYTCSAFDVSTCSFDSLLDVSGKDTQPVGMSWSNDGTKMFFVGGTNDSVYEYTCSAFDVSTCSFDLALSVVIQDNQPQGMSWSNDGTKMFMVGETKDKVHVYDLSDTAFTLIGNPAGNITSFADNGLLPVTEYTYKVSGDSINSTTSASTTLPDPPSSLTTDASSSTQIDLAWTAAAGSTGYKIFSESPIGNGFTLVVNNTSGTAYNNTGLTPGTEYNYKIASWGTTQGAISANTTSVASFTLLGSPTSLVVTSISTTQLDLDWVAPSGNVTGYKIERESSLIDVLTRGSDIGSNRVLVAGQVHKGDSSSTFGNAQGVFIGDKITTLAIRTGDIIVPGNLKLALYDNSDNFLQDTNGFAFSTPTHDNVWIELDFATPYVVQAGDLPLQVMMLSSVNMAYQSWLNHSGGNLDRDDGNTYPTFPDPWTFSGTVASNNMPAIRLTWEDGFSVLVADTGNNFQDSTPFSPTGHQNNMIDTQTFFVQGQYDLTDFTVTEITVRMLKSTYSAGTIDGVMIYNNAQGGSTEVVHAVSDNSFGEADLTGSFQDFVFVFTDATPLTDDNISFGIRSTSPTGTFSQETIREDIDGENIDGKQWTKTSTWGSFGSGDLVIKIKGNPPPTVYNDTSLSSATQYNYKVSAINDGGTGASSNEVANYTLPTVPANLTAGTISISQIDLNWDAPSGTIAGYQIERESPLGDGFSVIVADTGNNNTFYNNTGLTSATQYNYRVSAITGGGTGNVSNEAVSSTLPGAPTSLIVNSTSTTELGLTWTSPSGTIVGYKIEQESPIGDGFVVIRENPFINDTSYSDNNLSSATQYNYRVSALTNLVSWLPTATYTNNTFSVEPESTNNIISMDVTIDGKYMYMYTSNPSQAKVIHQYNLTIPYDLNSTVYTGKTFTTQPVIGTAAGQDLFFREDGQKFYIITDNTCKCIWQFSMSTPWDISTASYDSKNFVFTQENNPNGIHFKPDGTRVYLTGAVSDSIHSYTLSSAWDIDTASYDNLSFSVFSEQPNPSFLSFKPDGTQFFVGGQWTNPDTEIHQYTMSIPWNVTSAIYDNVFWNLPQITYHVGSGGSVDGNNLYVWDTENGNGDIIYQYSIYSNDVGAPSTEAFNWTQPDAPISPSVVPTSPLTFDTLDLSWTAPSGTVVGYVIEREQPLGNGFVVIEANYTGGTTYTDTGLLENTTYFYRVAAITNPIGPFSPPFNATTGDAPDAPLNVAATIVDPDVAPLDILVSWDAPIDIGDNTVITGYDIIRYADILIPDEFPGENTIVIPLNTRAFAWQVTGLDPNANITELVVLIRNQNASPREVNWGFYDDNAGAPGNLLYEQGNFVAFSLTHVEIIDITSPPTVPSDGILWVGFRSATSVSIHYYGITTGGLTVEDNTLSGGGLPDPFSVDNSESWNMAILLRSDGPYVSLVNDTAGLTYNDLAVIPSLIIGGEYAETVPVISNSSYTYAIGAKGDVIDGNFSAASNTMVTPSPPDPPTNGNTSIALPDTLPFDMTVTWDAPIDDGGSNVLGYTVYHSEDDVSYVNATQVSGLSAIVTVPSVPDDINYFKISAYNLLGYGQDSTTFNGTTPDVPDAPTGVTPTIPLPDTFPFQINVAWTTPVGDGGSAVTGYTLWRSTDDVIFTNITAVSHPTVSFLDTVPSTPSQIYHYKVSATNIPGYGVNSTSGNITVPDVPDPPFNVVALPKAGNTSIQITWNAPIDDGGSAVTGYRVQEQVNGGGYSTVIADTGTPTPAYTRLGLSDTNLYEYNINAINNIGIGIGNTTTTGVEFTVGTLVFVTNSTGSINSFSPTVDITFGIPDTTVAALSLYRNDVVIQSIAPSQDIAKGNQFTFSTFYDNPFPAGSYDYYMIATTNNGEGGQSRAIQSATVRLETMVLESGDKELTEFRNTNYTMSTFQFISSPSDYSIVIRYIEANSVLPPVYYVWDNVGVNVTYTIPVNAATKYYVSAYLEPTFSYDVGTPGNATIPGAYPITVSTVSHPDPGQVGLQLGIDTLSGDSGIFGLPLVFIFVIALASIFTGRSAPMGIIFIGVALGIMAYLGLIDFNFDPTNESSLATWALIIIAIIIGVMVGKRWD